MRNYHSVKISSKGYMKEDCSTKQNLRRNNQNKFYMKKSLNTLRTRRKPYKMYMNTIKEVGNPQNISINKAHLIAIQSSTRSRDLSIQEKQQLLSYEMPNTSSINLHISFPNEFSILDAMILLPEYTFDLLSPTSLIKQ